jgi:hypothetical protein
MPNPKGSTNKYLRSELFIPEAPSTLPGVLGESEPCASLKCEAFYIQLKSDVVRMGQFVCKGFVRLEERHLDMPPDPMRARHAGASRASRLDTPAAAHFLSLLGLLLESVWIVRCARPWAFPVRILGGDRVEKEAEGELGHCYGCRRGTIVHLPANLVGPPSKA